VWMCVDVCGCVLGCAWVWVCLCGCVFLCGVCVCGGGRVCMCGRVRACMCVSECLSVFLVAVNCQFGPG